MEIHYTAGVKASVIQTDEVAAVDAGLSEVFTDDEGNRYGMGLGQLIYDESDRVLDKNRKRQINTALNNLMKKRQPSILVTEKLDIRGKAKSKKMSRQVSLWPRGVLQERTEFKASAASCRREQVNPAYTSQMCPVCWFVNGKNRNGDRFKCLHCGHVDVADGVAAQNLKARRTDPEITLWTPKEQVKAVLLARFAALHQEQRSAVLETVEPGGEAGTVAGRTPVATLTKPDGALSTERETTDVIPIG